MAVRSRLQAVYLGHGASCGRSADKLPKPESLYTIFIQQNSPEVKYLNDSWPRVRGQAIINLSIYSDLPWWSLHPRTPLYARAPGLRP